VLLSESNDGIMSFFFGDSLITGGQLFDNPVLHFLFLLISQIFPFGLYELLSALLGEHGINLVDVLGLGKSILDSVLWLWVS
jgi:hypothetical protein